MSPSVALVILWALASYGAVGALFGLPFLARGASRIDPGAQRGTWGFRVAIFPGVVALWPVLALRWYAAARGSR